MFLSIHMAHSTNYPRENLLFLRVPSDIFHHLEPHTVWYGQIRVADDSY